ncbi:thioesterase domain-containing protein [Saccharothrix deserti]|uniref:thioesterase domain-containing protein n=1 Tax=Saccharothrix deserti TaxID=2593674 RepID=UPI00131D84B1|nr:thioesterase domain-containing protein [Saccharothrix deserti]
MNPTVDDVTDTGYQHPRDPVELWLARQWQEVIGFAVGIRENFFQVGGNSLDAARLINAVLEEFGVQLPLNVMTEHPTVESLATRLRDQNERLSDPLVPIQRGDGTRPPLFLVHPATGQVGAYCHLAQALGEEFTLFGLQATGLYSDADPVRTVPAMARAYVDAVRAVRPAGPYLLGGCSTGAAIAYEMATQLAHTGAEVRLLAVIDVGLLDAVTESWFDESPRDEDLTGVLDRWKARGVVPQDATPEFVARSLRVWQANQDAVRDWSPQPYSGPLDVFRGPSGDRSPTADWPVTAVQRVHEHTTDSRHLAGALHELIG